MVSESQERMLCVVEPRECEGAVDAVCEKVEVNERGDRHGHRLRQDAPFLDAGELVGRCR